jgi:hypothetical protein
VSKLPKREARQAKGSAPRPEIQRAATIASHVALDAVKFLSFSGTCPVPFDELPDDWDLGYNYGFTAPVSVEDGNDLKVTTTFIFSLHGKIPESTEEQTVVSLRLTTRLDYSKKKNWVKVEDDSLREFSEINAPFNAWGYWREFVQSSLGRFGYPSVTLPLFRATRARNFVVQDDL